MACVSYYVMWYRPVERIKRWRSRMSEKRRKRVTGTDSFIRYLHFLPILKQFFYYLSLKKVVTVGCYGRRQDGGKVELIQQKYWDRFLSLDLFVFSVTWRNSRSRCSNIRICNGCEKKKTSSTAVTALENKPFWKVQGWKDTKGALLKAAFNS